MHRTKLYVHVQYVGKKPLFFTDPTFLTLCARLGPLASFESLLSMHGEDVAIFNDMLVAVEDLRAVEFTLILVDKRARVRARKGNDSGGSSNLASRSARSPPLVQLLQYHSFPLPRVTGSRSSLKVMLPVPDYVYTMLPLEQIKTMTFSVTPVLFNVGINEQATIAGRMPGANAPQDKNNVDNFKILQVGAAGMKFVILQNKYLVPTTYQCWLFNDEI